MFQSQLCERGAPPPEADGAVSQPGLLPACGVRPVAAVCRHPGMRGALLTCVHYAPAPGASPPALGGRLAQVLLLLLLLLLPGFPQVLESWKSPGI